EDLAVLRGAGLGGLVGEEGLARGAGGEEALAAEVEGLDQVVAGRLEEDHAGDDRLRLVELAVVDEGAGELELLGDPLRVEVARHGGEYAKSLSSTPSWPRARSRSAWMRASRTRWRSG